MSENTFKHSGKIGDVIYSLALVRQFGSGSLLLNPNDFYGFSVGMCKSLLPLLEKQPYLAKVGLWEGQPITHDLDVFRNDKFPWRTNIVKQHFDAFGIEPDVPIEPWLTVDHVKPHGRTVFARSLKCNSIPGFWPFYREMFPDAVFVGTPEEHRAMVNLIGPIDYYYTGHMLDLARLIAGAPCFVGNQSSPYAVAQALGVSTIQEVDATCPNCVFVRPNAYYVTRPDNLEEFSDSRWSEGNAPEIGVSQVAVVEPVPYAGTLNEPPTKRCSVIIVTYNSVPTLEACISSVRASMLDADELIIVDNASTDGTQEMLAEYGKLPNCQVVLSATNLGFSAANNHGIRMAKGEFIVLLNPDTEVPPNWIEKMASRFVDPQIGAVGPTSNRVSGFQYVGCHLPADEQRGLSKHQLVERLEQFHPRQSMSTKLLIGFCIMFKREVLNQVGLLDETMFLGSEDLEISWRLREFGYLLLIAVDVFVWHDAAAQSFQSLEKSQTQKWLDESTQALKDKLARAYPSPARVSALELWGVDFW